MTDTSTMRMSVSEGVRANWGWFIALGVLFIIGGLFAIVSPLIASLVVTRSSARRSSSRAGPDHPGWRMRSWSGFIWQLIIGIDHPRRRHRHLVNPSSAP